MAHAALRQKWILDWLKSHTTADVTNTFFHDSYALAFPEYKRILKNWGAQPVPQAMRDLSELERCGIIGRYRLTLWYPEPGFPKWVWVYFTQER